MNACEVKAHLIGCWQNLVVAAVLRDSLCVMSLLPCVQTVVCHIPCVMLSSLS